MVDMQRPLLFQLTAARRRLAGIDGEGKDLVAVSTHSRPKAAGQPLGIKPKMAAFQLTAARRRLVALPNLLITHGLFQLTAARRRLVPPLKPLTGKACIALFR